MDINLNDMKGTVLALMLQKTAPEAAVDYIMKPFNKERVEKALKKAELRRRLNGLGELPGGKAVSAAPTAAAHAASGVLERSPGLTPFPENEKIPIHHDKRVTLIDPSEIVYVESNQRNCRVCCTGENST